MSDAHLIDKRLVRRSFEHAAHTYDAAAVLQREVCARMFERLEYIKCAPSVILDAGSGTGQAGARLRQRFPAATIVELDIALGMLARSREQLPWWQRHWPMLGGARMRQVCADMERLPLAHAGVGMIWSNLALQWMNDLEAAVREMARVLAPDGLLMFSTFGPDTLKELRQAYAAADAHSHVNRFIDMHDIGDMLVAAGFADPVMDMEHITLTYAEVMQLMRELKAIGAHNVTQGRRHGLGGKALLRTVAANYEGLRKDGKLPATFEVVYGHAWKARHVPRKIADGRQVVELHFDQRPRG